MPNRGVSRRTRANKESSARAELAGAVEGHIAEMCHELAAQVKQMRRLQEQAEELRTALLLWLVPSDGNAGLRAPASRGGRR
jgi:hypothetical protein